MKLVTIKQNKLKGYTSDKEMLHNANRPCVLIVNLTYKGRRYDFAVPLRSNINIKMFPVRREWSERFHFENNIYMALIKGILDTGEKQIVADCQAYLRNYENGIRPKFSTNIDYLIGLL